MNTFAKELVDFVQDHYGTKKMIPLHSPFFRGKEKEYLIDTIDSTFVSSVGAYVNKFERLISEFTGAKFAIATTNGTSALHASLLLLGVQPGDEVITQSLTFVATCNAIRYCHADPIFTDVDKKTLGMSPESLSHFLEEFGDLRDDGYCWNLKTGRPIRVCVPMHNFGHPVRIDEIKNICEKYNIEVLEDAAESLGSFFKEKHTGRFGKVAIISFNGNKIITAGGGGMIITDDEIIAKKAKHITTTSKKSHPWLFIHDQLGFNYRLPNLNAALGCAQMESLLDFIKIKRNLAKKYNEWFISKEFQFIVEPNNAKSNYWINAFVTNSMAERDQLLDYLNKNKVMARPTWTPMHTLEMFNDCQKTQMKNTNWLHDHLVNIPSGVSV
jgi:perosamine synthetase